MAHPSNSIWKRHHRRRRQWQFEIAAALVALTTAVAIKMALLVNERAHTDATHTAASIPNSAPGTCAEARSRGVDNARRGEEGYAPHLDRDGDGVACEPYR